MTVPMRTAIGFVFSATVVIALTLLPVAGTAGGDAPPRDLTVTAHPVASPAVDNECSPVLTVAAHPVAGPAVDDECSPVSTVAARPVAGRAVDASPPHLEAGHTPTRSELTTLWFLPFLGTMGIDRFLRLRQVVEATGLSRAQIYRLIERGEFPRQIPLTAQGRSVAWSEADVQAWQDARISAARALESGSGRAGAAR